MSVRISRPEREGGDHDEADSDKVASVLKIQSTSHDSMAVTPANTVSVTVFTNLATNWLSDDWTSTFSY